MFQIATIPFLSSEGFLSILDRENNTIYASPKSICEAFGMDWSSQQTKLANDSTRWQYKIIMIKLPGADRKRRLGVIPDKKVRSWVCSINPDKVRQDTREQLIAFQDECDAVLHNYWSKGIAINPRYQPDEGFKQFIVATMGGAIKEAMCELAVALRETFVTRESFQTLTNQYEQRLSALEDRAITNFAPSSSTYISMEQAQMLRKLVKEKGQSRKGIFAIWKQFRQKFMVDSYQHLPDAKFSDALRWVNQL